MKNIIFVCTGNTCRSPMAEGLLRRLLGPEQGWTVSSAGTCAIDGMPPASTAVQAMRDVGVDISMHRSRRLTPSMVEKADMLVVMTRAHREAVLACAPSCTDKVFLLNAFGTAQCPADVYDPVGEPLDIYRRVRDEIDAAMPDLVLTLLEKKG